MRIVALATVLSVMLACSVSAQDVPKDGPPKDEAKDVPKDLPKDKANAEAKERVETVTAAASMICIIVPIGLGLVVYFTPIAIALLRGHPNMPPIMIVNIFLGWTIIGWILALTWSFTAQERHRDDYGRRPRRRSEDD